jgi:hypothetical protein
MPDEPVLRERARERLRAGKLPVRAPDRTFGGAGNGEPCAVCGQLITRDQLELEIDVNRSGATSGTDTYHFHTRCFAAWEFERTKVRTD